MSARLPLIVVGAGVAGLSTALAAAPRPVLLLSATPACGSGSASVLAQGGIAAALGAGDSVGAHACDTMAAGAGHNARALVRLLARAAPGAIDWLQACGVAFDRDQRQLALGREGGHGVARIVHAGGDATGAAVVAALSATVRAAAHVEWRDDVDVDALLCRGGAVAGVRLRQRDGDECWLRGEVVLATGGIGGLFARSTNPAGAQGAGLALGMAAGARMRDLEFVQFHPTALDVAGASTLPLLTEALRGAGACLRDAHGRALMAGHPLADLAPRDVVARRVWLAQREHGPVWLDATAVDALEQRFPTVHGLCRGHGIDPARQPIAITPAAHFHMGGLATDRWGRTSVAGLHAVGEVAGNGVHGANRLASNSLLEGVVFGRRLGRRLAMAPAAAAGHGAWTLAGRGADATPSALAGVRALLWHAGGPLRHAAALDAAIVGLAAIDAWQARLAGALLMAARARPHSLGAHWRDDDPRLPTAAVAAPCSG